MNSKKRNIKNTKKNKCRQAPTKEQVQRWKLKNWEKNWDKELIQNILNNIREEWNLGGTIIAPSLEVLGYILGELRIPYLLHCIIRLDKEFKKICFIKKKDDYYIDYIPF